MSLKRLRPTSNQVAQAVVTACRLVRGGRDQMPGEEVTRRARDVALKALADAYPHLLLIDLAGLVGEGPTDVLSLKRRLRDAESRPWWDDAFVDEIVGELVGELYGAQAS